MANMLFANNCNTTLASSLTSGATSMSVTSATGFPSPTGVQYFYCTLADAATQTTIEIVKVTSVSGTTFAITRAQDGTSATAFAAGAVVSLRLVRASLNDFPKLDETNTFNADQAISGQLTSSAGLATTGTFTATAPSDGLVMDYATGFGRFSAFAGDGFQWYNAGIANTKLMQLSSSGVITTATWNGATVGVAYGGTGLTSLTAGYISYGNGTSAFSSASTFTYNATNGLGVNGLTLGYNTNLYATDGTLSNYSSANSVYLNGNAAAGLVLSGDGSSSTRINIYATSANYMAFFTASAERARIDSSGNLLVGTTGPQNNAIFSAKGTAVTQSFPGSSNTTINTIYTGVAGGGGLCIIRGQDYYSGGSYVRVYAVAVLVAGGAGTTNATLISTANTSSLTTGFSFAFSASGSYITITSSGFTSYGGIWTASFIGL